MVQNKPYTKPILFLIIITFILTSFPISFAAEQNNTDGFYTDTFTNALHVDLTNHCDIEQDSIILRTEISSYPYSFALQPSDHEAYYYSAPFFMAFLKPTIHLPFEKTFETIGLSNLKQRDGQIVTTPGTLLRKNVIHHFRFEVPQDSEYLTELEISWRGKAENDRSITLYYWQPIGNFGRWVPGSSNYSQAQSDGAMINLSETTLGNIEKLFIQEDNIVDICIVARPSIGKQCSLSSDYIEITARGRGHALKGSVTSSLITPSSLATWEQLSFDDYTPSGTSIRYHLLYSDETLIQESILPGNSNGFTSSQSLVNLDVDDIEQVKIRANLTSSYPSKTPKIYQWNLLWQTTENTWRDLFESTLRIQGKSNVQIDSGEVSVIPAYTDWAMFGQNPDNTRVSDGAGPASKDIYWYSSSSVLAGSGYKNPVIMNGELYIISADGTSLYVFNTLVDSADVGSYNPIKAERAIPEHIAQNTPAVTNDLIIIATGNTSSGGEENKIFAFDRAALSADPVWTFTHPTDSTICYSGSPIVYENTIFTSSWSGDDSLLELLTQGNNRLIALDMAGNMIWDTELPAGSFSTPAASDGIVVVGCDNGKNESLFAYDAETHAKLWGAAVGSIRHASPVIYDNTVFVVVKQQMIPFISAQAKLVAVDLQSGNVLWNKSVSKSLLSTLDLSQCTPTIFNNVVYVASPDGTLYAFDTDDGSELWNKQIYTKGVTTPVLQSSPVYAGGKIYVGTPEGIMYALHSSNGNEIWKFEETENNAPIKSSPIVVDGIIYFSDENGLLYSLGTFSETEEDQITGSLTSIPIVLPPNYHWNHFFADKDNSSGGDIMFSIRDIQNTVLASNVKNGDNISDSVAGYNTLRLHASFVLENSSQYAILHNWSLSTTPSEDNKKPVFFSDTFIPSEGWITTPTPTCSIKVQDTGKGLLVSSAQFTIEYLENTSTVHTYTADALCTGINGSIAQETISIDIASLSFSENITKLNGISFTISDIQGNTNTSEYVEFQTDTGIPSSVISNGDDIPEQCNSSPLLITATASDAISGIDEVILYYKYSLTDSFSNQDWEQFETDTESAWVWNFTDVEGGGYYLLCSVAVDRAGNKEAFPEEGDISFIFDPNMPMLPEYDSDDILWFKSRPTFDFLFMDDFKLESIWYQLDSQSSWTLISENIDDDTYSSSWSLSNEYWTDMTEGESYKISFKLIDGCGNIRETTSGEALRISKDTGMPQITLDISDFTSEWQWDTSFNLTAKISDVIGINQGSGITSIQLRYRFSVDNSSWSNWTDLDDVDPDGPYIWEFFADEGDGYYEFQLDAEDKAGNLASVTVIASASLFPVMLFIIMIGLFFVLVLVSLILIVKWKQRKMKI